MQFQFRIENLANTVDTFNASVVIDGESTFTPQNIEVYYDENGNGVVDPGEELWNNTIPISSGDFKYVIVMYRVPSATSAGATATVRLNVDSVNDPTNALDHDNAARTKVYNDAVLTLFKTATPQEVAAGDEVVYTIKGANVGNKAAADITIIDDLPASLEYLGFEDKVPAGMTIDVVDNKVTLHIASLSAGSGFQIRLRVKVKEDTTAGMIENVATMTYKTVALETVSRSSNVSTIMVGGPGNETTKVWIGPEGNPEAVDPNDITVEPGVAGTLVEFTNTVKNAGLSTDIINITIAEVFPAGLDS
ncbi:MAG: isopeptide-forming domain-containing fimbrial protein, partial [Kosmotogaceae bacterium]